MQDKREGAGGERHEAGAQAEPEEHNLDADTTFKQPVHEEEGAVDDQDDDVKD